MIDKNFWKCRRVFLTGHTGFKGSWLCLWLHRLGAKVTGYALEPPTSPSLFRLCRIEDQIHSIKGDIRDVDHLKNCLIKSDPEVVIHMAAQPLVRDSYKLPLETYQTNVMGTVNLLEAVKCCRDIKAVINVTSDKCYENLEQDRGYIENDPLGGFDPYSSSKACSEIITGAYRKSYFSVNALKKHNASIATARAGNVIGGGDWAKDRLVADFVKAILAGKKIILRNPDAVRPWQHVLEPLCGYLILAEKLYQKGNSFAEAWNFGPDDTDAKTVEWLTQTFCQLWGGKAAYEIDNMEHPHETGLLRLDCSKAKNRLNWAPKWPLTKALENIIDWTKIYQKNGDVKKECLKQIQEYELEMES